MVCREAREPHLGVSETVKEKIMNLIGNNCAGAAAYKYVLNQQYNNPFIWCRTDVVTLAKEWTNINFKNIRLYNENEKDLSGFWHIIIDGKCNLRFSHHKFDPKCKTVQIIEPTDTRDAEIRYYKIWEYLVQKYYERLERMSTNEYPVFLFYQDWQDPPERLEELKKYTNRIIICPKTPGCGVIKNVRIHANEIKQSLSKF